MKIKKILFAAFFFTSVLIIGCDSTEMQTKAPSVRIEDEKSEVGKEERNKNSDEISADSLLSKLEKMTPDEFNSNINALEKAFPDKNVVGQIADEMVRKFVKGDQVAYKKMGELYNLAEQLKPGSGTSEIKKFAEQNGWLVRGEQGNERYWDNWKPK